MAEQDIYEKIEKIKMPIRLAILIGTVIIIGAAIFFLIYKPYTEDINKVSISIGAGQYPV
jgi:hypothetical protein